MDVLALQAGRNLFTALLLFNIFSRILSLSTNLDAKLQRQIISPKDISH